MFETRPGRPECGGDVGLALRPATRGSANRPMRRLQHPADDADDAIYADATAASACTSRGCTRDP